MVVAGHNARALACIPNSHTIQAVSKSVTQRLDFPHTSRVVKLEILRRRPNAAKEKYDIIPTPFAEHSLTAYETNVDSIKLRYSASFSKNNDQCINEKIGTYDMDPNGSEIKGQAIDIII